MLRMRASLSVKPPANWWTVWLALLSWNVHGGFAQEMHRLRPPPFHLLLGTLRTLSSRWPRALLPTRAP